jgi:hypothetical protein
MIAPAQKHTSSADFTRGFCRHGLTCFENEKSSKLEAFSTAQICLSGHDVAQIALGWRQSSSDAAKSQLLKGNAPRPNPHRPR